MTPSEMIDKIAEQMELEPSHISEVAGNPNFVGFYLFLVSQPGKGHFTIMFDPESESIVTTKQP